MRGLFLELARRRPVKVLLSVFLAKVRKMQIEFFLGVAVDNFHNLIY